MATVNISTLIAGVVAGATGPTGPTGATGASGATTTISNGTSNLNILASGGAIYANTAGTNAITVDTSQNVGIGTASPSRKLEVSNTDTYQIRATGTGGGSGFLAYSNSEAFFCGIGGTTGGGAGIGKGFVGTLTNQPLLIYTNNTEKMRIDSAGNVGIGTTNPIAKLSVSNGGAEGLEISPSGGTVSLTAYNRSGAAYAQLNLTGTAGIGMSLGPSYITTNSNMSVTNIVAVGGATPASTGSGISFPATQSASTNANTLDDYEEGSFNSALGGSGNSFTQTYNSYYTKIGNVVTVMIFISWTAKSGSGGVTIDLPFAIGGTGRGGMSIGMFTNSTIISATKILYAQIDGGGTTINLRYSNNSVGWSGFTPAEMGSYGEIQIAGTYISA